jgi:hypothetical protein
VGRGRGAGGTKEGGRRGRLREIDLSIYFLFDAGEEDVQCLYGENGIVALFALLRFAGRAFLFCAAVFISLLRARNRPFESRVYQAKGADYECTENSLACFTDIAIFILATDRYADR